MEINYNTNLTEFCFFLKEYLFGDIIYIELFTRNISIFEYIYIYIYIYIYVILKEHDYQGQKCVEL